MSLATQLQDALTRVGTEFKAIRILISGTGTGGIAGLNTTDKSSLVAAINEVDANASGAPPDASTTVKGVVELATDAETATGTDTTRAITPAGLASLGLGAPPSAATEAAAGIAELATQAETTTGTDDARIVTPLKLAQKLTAWAQPLSANLTSLAGVVSGAFGRTLLQAADANAAKTSLGLAAIASSGSASDLVTGTIPTAVLPPLAINETFAPANEAAMLALTAQRGDMAIRIDNGKTYVLATDSPATLADWKEIMAAGAVQSVAGKTGVVSLVKGDVGLGNVDNTSDANKPISSATQTALNLKANAADMGDHTTDFVAVFEAALA
jgi:hypothetical protein